MKQTFRVLLVLKTDSAKKVSEAEAKKILRSLTKFVEEVIDVEIIDCDEKVPIGSSVQQ
jgi:hypothetical protein